MGYLSVDDLTSPDPVVRQKTLDRIAKDPMRCLPLLVSLLDSPSNLVRGEAVRALGVIQSTETVPYLLRMLEDPESNICCMAALLLASRGDPCVLPTLCDLLEKNDRTGVAAQALGRLGDSAAVAPLLIALRARTPAGIRSGREWKSVFWICRALVQLGVSSSEVISELRIIVETEIPTLHDTWFSFQSEAIEILGTVEAVGNDLFKAALLSKREMVSMAGAEILARRGEFRELVLGCLETLSKTARDSRIRGRARELLCTMDFGRDRP